MKTKIIISGIAVALIVGTTMKLQSNKRIVEANIYRPDVEKRILVQAVKAGREVIDRIYSYTGTFMPIREVMLIPQAHGEVTGVFFKEGDHVKQGKLLVKIDDDQLVAQFNSADANYYVALKNLARYEAASISGGVSDLQLDNLRLNAKTAESQLLQLRKQIDLTSIEAPFAGTITYSDVEIGSLAGNSPVARVTDLSNLRLEIAVPEKDIAMFVKGSSIEIVTDTYSGQTFRGKVTYVADRADQAHNYEVHIELPNSEKHPLKAGMYGTAQIGTAINHGTIVIPRSALIGSAKDPQVFIIEQERAKLVPIKTGHANGEMVEVTGGLSEGIAVITSGHINLTSGSKVEVVK